MSLTEIDGSRPAERDWGCDLYSDAVRTGQGPLFLRRADGWLMLLEVERWCARADAADHTVLDRCSGSVLDVGCGPGRMMAALAQRGHRALGVDLSQAAVRRAVQGGRALCRSVFDPLPDEGRWGTALLVDGNIGIGGDPHALLARIRDVVRAEGMLLVEAAPEDVDERVAVRMSDERGSRGTAFPWARVGLPALHRSATAAGWAPEETWSADGRVFAALRRA